MHYLKSEGVFFVFRKTSMYAINSALNPILILGSKFDYSHFLHNYKFKNSNGLNETNETIESNVLSNRKQITPIIGAKLWKWMLTWWMPGGAIHGFHNHPVWGTNPVRVQNNYSGHTTFASPLLMSAAFLLKNHKNDEVLKKIETSIRFQCSRINNDRFLDIGFEMGSFPCGGLIHNAVPLIMLSETAYILKEKLPEDLLTQIKKTVYSVLCDLEKQYPLNDPKRQGVSNQEYARIWAMQAYQKAFGQVKEWEDRIPWVLLSKPKTFFVAGLPDQECFGVVRSLNDSSFIEPAEYYGLIIQPYVLAWRQYGDKQFLDLALGMARYIVRNSWKDQKKCTRFHQSYRKIKDEYIKATEPMLISGMGLTLYAISELNKHLKDPELENFLEQCVDTYATYQHPLGFFVQATGWESEYDIAPSTAWHSHDMLFFSSLCADNPEFFWKETEKKCPQYGLLVGNQNSWFESADRYRIVGRDVQGWSIVGNKKSEKIFIEVPEFVGAKRPPEETFLDEPRLIYTDKKIYIKGGPSDMSIMSIASQPIEKV